MLSILHTLATPLTYIRIQHSFKRKIDRFSICFSCLISICIGCFCPNLNFFGTSGIVPSMNSLMGSLSGFFITGLAAVATFQGGVYNIDKPFNLEPAKIDGQIVSRRQFLCYLFGYLAFSSIVFCLFGIFSLSYANTPDVFFKTNCHFISKLLFGTIYACWLAHIMGATLVGLVFLSDRMSHSSTDTIYTIADDK